MSILTEAEIFECMHANLRGAVECCDLLVVMPAKGPLYERLRGHLRLVEGTCRQACYWREDTRWLPMGFLMNEACQRAGGWLRAKNPPTPKVFTLLADALRKAELVVNQIQHQATGIAGAILPEPVAVHRDTRPSRVLLPPGMSGGVLQ